ncbi:MAG TPA: TIGR03557 family F420-dependent LLM class oxidoreductase [Ilumatobacter sp.]|nr:TIGR03557 family F420-dependent LLM class oxidoreductase [Ilumatobacter sp.]
MQWGYTCSSEEHPVRDLVRFATLAEDVGFDFVTVSDHFHPWITEQGHSPFAWSTVAAIATWTSRVRLATGVTCPLIRTHPAIVAQAAATSSELSGGRFVLGVGSGEALNEHITGAAWPPIETRHAMLAEALEVIRLLWTGTTVDYDGEHYQVDNALLFDPPADPPDIVCAAAGPNAAELAARIADGLWVTAPSTEVIDAFRDAGGEGPVYGQLTVCYDTDRERAVETAHRIWPVAAVPGQLMQDLPTWTHFEQAAELVTPEMVAEQVVCGDDVGAVVDAVQAYVDAGVTALHLHQIGPDQEGFFRWWRSELGGALGGLGAKVAAGPPPPA